MTHSTQHKIMSCSSEDFGETKVIGLCHIKVLYQASLKNDKCLTRRRKEEEKHQSVNLARRGPPPGQ